MAEQNILKAELRNLAKRKGEITDVEATVLTAQDNKESTKLAASEAWDLYRATIEMNARSQATDADVERVYLAAVEKERLATFAADKAGALERLLKELQGTLPGLNILVANARRAYLARLYEERKAELQALGMAKVYHTLSVYGMIQRGILPDFRALGDLFPILENEMRAHTAALSDELKKECEG